MIYFAFRQSDRNAAARIQASGIGPELLEQAEALLPEEIEDEALRFLVEGSTEVEGICDPRLQSILAAHVNALGVENCESLILRGEYLTKGIPFDLSLTIKRPDAFKQQLSYKRLTIRAGISEGDYWQENPLSGNEDEAENAAQRLNASLLHLQCAHLALAWAYLDAELGGVSLGRLCIAGRREL